MGNQQWTCNNREVIKKEGESLGAWADGRTVND
jgi:hypothetical protein